MESSAKQIVNRIAKGFYSVRIMGSVKEYILPDETEIEAGVFTRISSDDLEEND